jgi:hypothetical protein
VIRGGVDLNETGLPVLLSGEMFPERPMYTGKTLFAQLMDFLPWTTFARIVERRSAPPSAAVKMHTLLDLRGAIPSFMHISDGKLHDVNVLERRIRLRDAESAKTLVFLSNQFALPAMTICALYKARWQVELFFKWVKQHLRIKRFFGTSENAVKSQIWIAVSVYVLVAIIKKRLNLDASLYTLLQILSVTLFEKMLIRQAVTGTEYKPDDDDQCN